jgi:hypothetical protein
MTLHDPSRALKPGFKDAREDTPKARDFKPNTLVPPRPVHRMENLSCTGVPVSFGLE